MDGGVLDGSVLKVQVRAPPLSRKADTAALSGPAASPSPAVACSRPLAAPTPARLLQVAVAIAPSRRELAALPAPPPPLSVAVRALPPAQARQLRSPAPSSLRPGSAQQLWRSPWGTRARLPRPRRGRVPPALALALATLPSPPTPPQPGLRAWRPEQEPLPAPQLLPEPVAAEEQEQELLAQPQPEL